MLRMSNLLPTSQRNIIVNWTDCFLTIRNLDTHELSLDILRRPEMYQYTWSRKATCQPPPYLLPPRCPGEFQSDQSCPPVLSCLCTFHQSNTFLILYLLIVSPCWNCLEDLEFKHYTWILIADALLRSVSLFSPGPCLFEPRSLARLSLFCLNCMAAWA